MNGLPIVVFAAIGAGLGLMAGGLGYGAILIAAGLALLAFRDPWRYVLVAAFLYGLSRYPATAFAEPPIGHAMAPAE